MSKNFKIQKPKYINDLESINDYNEDILFSDRIKDRIVDGIEILQKDDMGISIDSCVFKNTKFINCNLKNIDLTDTRFENCDLSNIDFSNSAIQRVEFVNCKLVGAKFDDSHFKDVVFKECVGRYSNFSFGELKNVE